MFEELKRINERPNPFQYYTAAELWADEYISKKMLEYHLNGSVDISSRNGRFIQRSVDWMIQNFKINSKTSCADFGCGPGLYTNKLAETGADITGIDFSKRSLNFAAQTAEKNGLDVNYIQGNYLEFDSDRQFDLISMIFCDFCALSPKQRKTLLGLFHRILKSAGAILLDVHSINVFNNKEEQAGYGFNYMDHFWSSDDYYCFYNTFLYNEEKVSLNKYTIVKQVGTSVIYNWLQYYTKESLIKEFEDNGFFIQEIYSDVAGTSYHSGSDDIAIVARKR